MLLHVTNGDSTSETIAETALGGEAMPWRDVLHEGPVPDRLDPRELAGERATFLAGFGYGDRAQIEAELRHRDRALAELPDDTEVVLWFEHDLYDQLQLIQILDRFRPLDLDRITISLIAIDRFSGVEPFYGLGQLDANQLASLFSTRRPVTPAMLAAASVAWAAFRSSDPTRLSDLATSGMPELPFLAPALVRFLEEYPSTSDGLGRTERQALTAIAAGHDNPVSAFLAWQTMESAPFLGDSTFWQRLASLSDGANPFLLRSDGAPFVAPPAARADNHRLELTDAGRRVLSGEADAVLLRGIDRWFGGVHLTGHTPAWRWTGQALVRNT